MSTKKEEYPANALQFSAELQFNEQEESPTVRMLARSSQPIDHWFWGNIVHDNSGAKFADSIPIDYCHDDKEIVGFANSENIRVDENQDLSINATLTPFTESDRASEILAKAKKGVPYQASINFAGDGIKLEKLEKGESSWVNGFEFNGPGVIVREWPLRGVAVCPYGADSNTKTEFQSSDLISVTIQEGEEMDNENELSEVAENAAIEEAQPVDGRAEFREFYEAFGAEIGGQAYAEGLSFAEASAKFAKAMKDENERLKNELELAKLSSSDVLPADVQEEAPAKKSGFAARFNFSNN